MSIPDTTNLPENAVVAELAEAAVEPTELVPGTIYGVSRGSGAVEIKDTDAYAANPRRAKAARTVNDAASFNGYFNRHKLPESEVWANTSGSTVVGIIDTHDAENERPGWEDHRVQLVLEQTKPWIAWNEFDGKFMSQLDFAEFIDQRAIDVRNPLPATLIEIAQHFQAKRDVDFKSSERLRDGQIQLNYEETIKAKAGEKGHLEIPETFELVLKPYIGGPAYYVSARFRYRMQGTAVVLGYLLERPQEILDAAFADIVDLIRNGKDETPDQEATATAPARAGSPGFKGVDVPIYYGRP